VRMVQHVISLHADHELAALLEAEGALQGHVHVEVTRAAETVRRDVAPVGLDRRSNARFGVGSEVGNREALLANRIALIATHTEGARNYQVGQRSEYAARAVDQRWYLAVGHAERRAAIFIHLHAHRPALDQRVGGLVVGFERLVPQQIGGDLVTIIEAETAIAIAEVERILVADRTQSMAPGVMDLRSQPV